MELLLASILFIGFFMRIPYISFPIDDDTGFYTYPAYFRKSGVRLLRGFWGGYPPTTLYIYLFIERLFGKHIGYVRHFTNLYNLLTISATYIVANYLFGTTAAIIAAFLYAVFSASPYLGIYSCHAEGFYILPVTLGVFAIAFGLLHGQPAYFTYAGGFMAASFLLKIVNIVYFLAFSLFLLIRHSNLEALYFSSAFLSTVALYTLFITWAYKGENRQFWRQHEVRLKTSISYIDNTLKGMWNRFKFDFIPIGKETWSIMLLSVISLCLLTPKLLNSVTYQLIFVWVLSTFSILISQRVFRMYQYIPLIQNFSILSVPAIYALIGDYKIVGLIIVSSVLMPNLYNKIKFYLLYWKDRRLIYFQKADQFFYMPEIARYIKERTTPDEYIYVWGPFVQIYRLADRLSCEGFLFHFVRPYTRWHTYLFDEIIGGVISKRPAYIVLIRPDFDIDVLKQITGLDYNLERVFFNRYRIYRLKGKIAEPMRIEDMQQEEKIKWLESLTHGSMDYGIDNFYIKNGMYDTAIKEFKEGLTLNPNDLVMKFEFAELLKNQMQYKDAIKLFQEIAEKDNKKEWLHFEMGVSYREMGEAENALKEFESEERLYPKKADTHHQRGIIYRQQGKYEKALTEFEQVLAINPKAEWSHHEMGVAYWKMGDIENAIKEFKIEEGLCPGKAVTLYSLYSVYAENGKREYAEDGFLRMLKNNEAFISLKAGCCFHIGKIYMEDNRINEAVKFFTRCLELLPEHKKAAEYLKQLKMDTRAPEHRSTRASKHQSISLFILVTGALVNWCTIYL